MAAGSLETDTDDGCGSSLNTYEVESVSICLNTYEVESVSICTHVSLSVWMTDCGG